MLTGQSANSSVLFAHREFEGAGQLLNEIGDSLDRGSVIIFPDPDSLLGSFLGPNLWLSHDLEALQASAPLRAEEWRAVLQEAEEQERKVYAIGERMATVLPDATAVALSRMSWHIPELERTAEHFPRQVHSFDFDFTIWHISGGNGTISYQPSTLLTEIGEVVHEDNGVVLRGQGDAGYLCYGPYHEFPLGHYVARFKVANPGASSRPVVLDVVQAVSSSLTRRSVDIEPGDKPRTIDLPFAVASTGAKNAGLEFRVLLPSGGRISLSEVEIFPVTPSFKEERSWWE